MKDNGLLTSFYWTQKCTHLAYEIYTNRFIGFHNIKYYSSLNLWIANFSTHVRSEWIFLLVYNLNSTRLFSFLIVYYLIVLDCYIQSTEIKHLPLFSFTIKFTNAFHATYRHLIRLNITFCWRITFNCHPDFDWNGVEKFAKILMVLLVWASFAINSSGPTLMAGPSRFLR